MEGISILGSTGSIGTQTLEVIKQHDRKMYICALSAGSQIDALKTQIMQFRPDVISVQDELLLNELRRNIGTLPLSMSYGDEGNILVATAQGAKKVVVALPGSCAINPTLAAIRSKKDIALATKEVLVSAGQIVMAEARTNGVKILPIDSEHSAIFQCLEGRDISEVKTIYLTCSGGPFRGKKESQLKNVTVADVLNHPTWRMGKKITVDSATLMNKGFEVIEAMRLFDVPLSKIKVIVHPQSVIHSLVEFIDGSILAQLGPVDMRIPIQYALLYPEKRVKNNFNRFSFSDYPTLSFEQPDLQTFLSLKLAFEAAQKGGTATAVLTAANDVAVEAFLNNQVNFLDIPDIIRIVLDKHVFKTKQNLDQIINIDNWSRKYAQEVIDKYIYKK